MTTRATYSFENNLDASNHGGSKRGLFSRTRPKSSYSYAEDSDPTDGNASLTYSAASSVNSGGSAAGESTDSSFADIMRVLDVQDSQELKELMKKEGVSSVEQFRNKRIQSNVGSIQSSLNYSYDEGSQLDGAQMLQTIAGQPSDSFGYDRADCGKEEADYGMMFAPAQPTLIKKKKKNHRSSPGRTPTKTDPRERDSPATPEDTPTRAPPDFVTPPRQPEVVVENAEEDDEVWYAKWWMFCFPDQNLMPKR